MCGDGIWEEQEQGAPGWKSFAVDAFSMMGSPPEKRTGIFLMLRWWLLLWLVNLACPLDE
jgi:hypothetical protein